MTSAALVHEFTPRGACLDLIREKAGEVLIAGPAGTGKSRACLEKLHGVALANAGMRGLIVRKTATSLTSSALVTWKRDVAGEAIAGGALKFYGGSAELPPQYQYSNGSVINIGGMDKASKIMSTEYDLAYVQEATELTLEDWESLTTRLRNGVVSFQQVIADCNPSMPTHWLKLRCEAGTTQLLESLHTDNPRLYDDGGVLTPYGSDYMGRLDALTGIIRLRLRDGKWTSAEGVIYDGFSDVHVVDRFDIPDGWERWWAVDFGFTNPFVLQCWAEDPDGRLFLYRELYRTQRTVDQHARDILDVVTDGDGQWIEPRPRVVVCDHDPEAQSVLRRELGLTVVDAEKAVAAGIQACKRRFKMAGDGKPRIFLMRDSAVSRDDTLVQAHKPASTLEELPGYVWKPVAAGRDTVAEEPLKENDHGVDAMRYIVMHRETKRPAKFRWVQ